MAICPYTPTQKEPDSDDSSLSGKPVGIKCPSDCKLFPSPWRQVLMSGFWPTGLMLNGTGGDTAEEETLPAGLTRQNVRLQWSRYYTVLKGYS